MCPEEERIKRVNESDVHKLELPYGNATLQDLMVKKFQRSSADHELQIAHLLRTPKALLKSIRYIENYIMNKANEGFDARCNEVPTNLFVYLFVWDRYRMIAKDFTLQQSAVALSSVWVECAERMARWFILMDHKMQGNEDYVGGHAQQNGEQLNNLLKTLHGYYFRARTFKTDQSSADSLHMPNKAEFVGYFIIFQLGNGGEVSKYLQQLPEEVLNSEPIKFTLLIWSSLKTENYASFFKLLKKASILQACLMHRYVGEVRMLAIRKIVKTFCIPNARGLPSVEFCLSDLIRWLCFEGVSDVIEWVEHCGLEWRTTNGVDPDEVDLEAVRAEDITVHFENQNIDNLLPRDKNDHPILPRTNFMRTQIDESKSVNPSDGSTYSIADIARGYATGAVVFNDLEYLGVPSDAHLFPNLPPLSSVHIASSASAINSTIEQRLKDKIRKKSALVSSNTVVVSSVAAPPPPPAVVTSAVPPPSVPSSKPDRSALLSGSLGSSRGTKVTPPKDQLARATNASNAELDAYYSRATPPSPIPAAGPSSTAFSSPVNYGATIPKFAGKSSATPPDKASPGLWERAKPAEMAMASVASPQGPSGFAAALESFGNKSSVKPAAAPSASAPFLFTSGASSSEVALKGRQQKPEEGTTTITISTNQGIGRVQESFWSATHPAEQTTIWSSGDVRPVALAEQPQVGLKATQEAPSAPLGSTLSFNTGVSSVQVAASQPETVAAPRHNQRSLEHIEQQIMRRTGQTRLSLCLTSWRLAARSSAQSLVRSVQRLRLRQWREACAVIRRQREQLLDALETIQTSGLTDPLTALSVDSANKARDRTEKSIRSSVAQADRFKQHYLLVDALEVLEVGTRVKSHGKEGLSIRQLFSYGGSAPRLGDSLLSSDLLPLLGKVLQLEQDNHIAETHGLIPRRLPEERNSSCSTASYLEFVEQCATSSDVPRWEGSLFLNMAVLSSSSTANVWTDGVSPAGGNSFIVNLLRLLLSKEDQTSDGLTKNQLHKRAKIREAKCAALVRGSGSVPQSDIIGMHACPVGPLGGTRCVNVGVTDLCASSARGTEVLRDTQGVLIALDVDLILKSREAADWLSQSLKQLRDCITNCVPFVIILCETACDPSAKVSSVSHCQLAIDGTSDKLSRVVSVLNRLLHSSLNLPLPLCDFQHLLVSAYLVTVTTSGGPPSLSLNNWCTAFSSSGQQVDLFRHCYTCLSFALCDLARHSPPYSLVQRVRVEDVLKHSISLMSSTETFEDVGCGVLGNLRAMMMKCISSANSGVDDWFASLSADLAEAEAAFPHFPPAAFKNKSGAVSNALWKGTSEGNSLPVGWIADANAAVKSLSHFLPLLKLPDWCTVPTSPSNSVVDIVRAECGQYQLLLVSSINGKDHMSETKFAESFAASVVRLCDAEWSRGLKNLYDCLLELFKQIMFERLRSVLLLICSAVDTLCLPEKSRPGLPKKHRRLQQDNDSLIEHTSITGVMPSSIVYSGPRGFRNEPKNLKRGHSQVSHERVEQRNIWRDFMAYSETKVAEETMDYSKRAKMDASDDPIEVSLDEQLEAIQIVNSMLAEESFTISRLNDYLQSEILIGGSTRSGKVAMAQQSSVYSAEVDPMMFIEKCRAERQEMENKLSVANRLWQ